jgi:hypothetical protein
MAFSQSSAVSAFQMESGAGMGMSAISHGWTMHWMQDSSAEMVSSCKTK